MCAGLTGTFAGSVSISAERFGFKFLQSFEHDRTLIGERLLPGYFFVASESLGDEASHELASVNILIGESILIRVIELQSTNDSAFVKNRDGNHRLNSTTAALLRVDQKFGIDISATEYLRVANAGKTESFFSRNFSSQGESLGACHSAIANFLSFHHSNGGAARSRDIDHTFSDQRHRLFEFEIANLNLVLGGDDLRQSKGVVAVRSSGRWRGWLRGIQLFGLSFLFCFKLVAPQIEAQLEVADFPVMFLKNISGLQQLGERLLVENWFVFPRTRLRFPPVKPSSRRAIRLGLECTHSIASPAPSQSFQFRGLVSYDSGDLDVLSAPAREAPKFSVVYRRLCRPASVLVDHKPSPMSA